ncbi:hypothetical protein [Sphingomicrobium nitratireducens]|uniref:hypothetical protein n=1 Tax=Sphingomicrobium nitratireducens TaxID=2964666 RepID=UPI00224023A9|nr:hypothetical protein [Sphingomicrobium nitratireducens]
MRYFLDTEYNGFGGALLSLALVPDDPSDEEFYARLHCEDPIEAWVERHVIPYLDTVPEALRCEPGSRDAVAHALAHFLGPLEEAEIVADWPEDLAQFSMLLVTGPGVMVSVPPLSLRLLNLSGFSTAANSAVPHNALHDARALRDHVTNHLE